MGDSGLYGQKGGRPGRLRIFIGYHEVAKFCSSLAAAFRAQGQTAHFCDLLPHPYYKAGRLTRIERDMRQFLTEKPGEGKEARERYKARKRDLQALLFEEMKSRYDVFLFVDRFSPLGTDERAELRKLGKRVISVFLGSDSRPLYMNGAFWAIHGDDYGKMASAVEKQRGEVRRIEEGSDLVVCHALSAHFLTRPFARFFAIGFPQKVPLALRIWHAAGRRAGNGTVRILHAPSKPEFKGSEEIARAVAELREEGLPLELVLLTGQPNGEVLREIRRCDFVVDEAYSDTPLAGFGVEAGLAGRLPVVGSYATEPDFLGDRLPPSVFVEPGGIKEAIRALALDPERRKKGGKATRAFLRKEWRPRQVASRYLRLFAGEGDPSWFSSPGDISYLHGWGIPEDKLRRRLNALIGGSLGAAVLRLEDKPGLEKAFLEFSAAPSADENAGRAI